MPAINCRIDRKQHKKLFNIIGEWAESDLAQNNFRDSYDAALKLLEPVFNVDANTITEVPLSDGQIGVYQSRLKELNKAIKQGRLGNIFSQFFYTTQHYGKRDPIISNDFTQKQRIQQTYKENTNKIDVYLKAITDGLRDSALYDGMTKRGIRNAKKELKGLNELYAQGKAAYLNNEIPKAKELQREYMAKEKELMDGTYGSIVNKMVNIIEKDIPKIVKEKKYKIDADGSIDTSLLAKDLKELYPKEDTLLQTVVTYTKLTNDLYSMLDNATNKHVDIIIKKLESSGKIDNARDLKEIKKSLNEKMKPQREIGYYPHFTRDFNISLMDGYMTKLSNLQDSINPYNLTKKQKSVDEAISDVRAYLSEFTQKRARDPETNEFIFDYSRNLPEVLANYSHDVARFNFNSFMNANFIESLNAIEKIYQTDGDAKGYAQNIADYIQDMHVAYNGKGESSVSTNNLVRSILSFEFISKLGYNPRSAVRNATQRALDFVVWGRYGKKKIKNYLENEGVLDIDIQKFLIDKGILFKEAAPDIEETLRTKKISEMNLVQWNDDTNKFEYVKTTKGEKLADGLSFLATKTSGMHRFAENKNRMATFKFAFGQMHKYLNTVDFKAKLSKEGKSEKQITEVIQKKAENYATRMTVLNHFDYSQYAKSPFMRTKAGAILGQFQHYSFEFFERNVGILKEGKEDIKSGSIIKKLLSGEGKAEGLSQSMRMGLIYFLAPAIAASITGLNFKSLIQHDTAERVSKLALLFTGDEEEIIAANYGKDFFLNTLGPGVGTVVDVGLALDFIDTDTPGLGFIASNYRRYDPNYDDKSITKNLSIINVASGRLIDRHIPQMLSGRVGWAVQSEMGLYATEESKKSQQRLMESIGFDPKKRSEKLKKDKADVNVQDVLASLDFLSV